MNTKAEACANRAPSAPRKSEAWDSHALLWGVALVVLVALAFGRSLGGDFLWDDDSHITANPRIIGPLGLSEIWTTAEANYFPLVLTSFWIQHALWGLNPLGYHVVTLACHAVAAVLLWRLLLRLRVPGAWLGAALWAVHPVQVESVAWICELKNTQSAVFFLLSAICFTTWIDATCQGAALRTSASMRAYGWALGCAVLALLSKPSTVMLPVALLLIAWRCGHGINLRLLTRLAPFFALSLVASGWTVWEQKFHSGAMGAEWDLSPLQRLFIAGRAVWFYLGKLAWPHPLIFIYPRWSLDVLPLGWFLPGVGVVAGLATCFFARSPVLRACFLPAAYFVALLFPVLGFFSVYFFRYSFVADHFQYLASMGPLALLGAAVARSTRWRGLIGGGLVAALAFLSGRECGTFSDNPTLWRITAERNPSAPLAWETLGALATKAGRLEEGIACYHRALALKPDDREALVSLGGLMTESGRPDEATRFLEAVLALKDDAGAHNNLGYALSALGRLPEAMKHYEAALRLRPDYPEAENNFGIALARAGRAAEALPHFERALRGVAERPEGRTRGQVATEALTRYNYGLALLQAGQAPEALAQFQRVLALKPENAQAATKGGIALIALGRPAEARALLARAIALEPGSAEAHHYLGMAIANAGAPADSVAEFEKAIALAPRNAEYPLTLARVFEMLGREAEAARMRQRAAAVAGSPEPH
jgi:tetratricopeptide (TPR) repeat protein